MYAILTTCPCVSTCVYRCEYMCVSICVCMYVRTSVLVFVCQFVLVGGCRRGSTRICEGMCIRIGIGIGMYACMQADVYVFAHICIYLHTHSSRIYTCMCDYVCQRPLSQQLRTRSTWLSV